MAKNNIFIDPFQIKLEIYIISCKLLSICFIITSKNWKIHQTQITDQLKTNKIHQYIYTQQDKERKYQLADIKKAYHLAKKQRWEGTHWRTSAQNRFSVEFLQKSWEPTWKNGLYFWINTNSHYANKRMRSKMNDNKDYSTI